MKKKEFSPKTELEKELKQRFIKIRNGALITPHLFWILKLIGCQLCYGKGYSTGYKAIGFCVCERGKSLEKIWEKKNDYGIYL